VATTTQVAAPSRTTTPLALWHLLSLDAPTVAALWTWFVARSCGIILPVAAVAAMALAVWIIYAADRLLDASRFIDTAERDELEARHLFHHRHRRVFVLGIALATAALAALIPRLDHAALRLYLLEGGLLSAWLIFLHTARRTRRLPKEIAVGIFFSAAVFIPSVARRPELRLALLPLAMLFALLCCLNCLFIYAWEHEGPQVPESQQPHATTSVALRHLPRIAVAALIAGICLAVLNPLARVAASACVLSVLALLWLDRERYTLCRVHLRAAADLALLTPLLLLPVLPWFAR